MSSRPLVLFLACISATGCITLSTSGPSPKQIDKEAIALYARGMGLYAQHRFASALSSFEKARELRGGAMLEVQIARTLDRMGQGQKACAIWVSFRSSDIAALVEQQITGADIAKREIQRASASCIGSGDGLPLPQLGPDDAPVTILIVSDFQCPFCARVQTTLKRIMQTWPGQIRFVFLHQPLSFHRRARPAAAATIAAQLQGQFWEMHDLLFDNPRDLSPEHLDRAARSIGLDLTDFHKSMKMKAIATFIDRNVNIANALGARGTPTFFVNGTKLSGAQPFGSFEKKIRSALDEAAAEVEKGTSPTQLHAVLSKRNNPVYDKLIIRREAPPAPSVKRPNDVPDTVWRVGVHPEDARQGPDDALVTVVAFTDFQCPYCAKAAKTLHQVRKAYGDRVRIVIKHNPLAFHQKAPDAAIAAMAAQAQGRFWEMHDALFENSRKLSGPLYQQLAEQLGLDQHRFDLDMKKHRAAFQARIARDQRTAAEVKATGTPNFFINGRNIRGARPYATFEALIDEELSKAKRMLSEGVEQSALYKTIMGKGKTFQPFETKVHTFSTRGRPQLGPKKAPITVTLFTDYQCPFCKRLDPEFEALVDAMKGRVRIVYKQFPLPFHKQARNAALAALAANQQRRGFRAMHSLLYKHSRELSEGGYVALARQAKLKVKRFAKSIRSERVTAQLEKDLEEARAAGLKGTPTFYVNGRKYQGTARKAAGIQRAIEKYFPIK